MISKFVEEKLQRESFRDIHKKSKKKGGNRRTVEKCNREHKVVKINLNILTKSVPLKDKIYQTRLIYTKSDKNLAICYVLKT